ncbi:MAG: acetate--CoA ligase family protein [Ardenticatenaceae bacterium]|nr:acetate--CoA ligase family protein [Ardenticatenaceae bacterium]
MGCLPNSPHGVRHSVPGSGLATTADEAVAIARRVGLPVALKIASADVPHKSDVGGVVWMWERKRQLPPPLPK